MSDTPELDKLSKIDETGDNDTIGAFLEWATSEGGYNFTKTETVMAEGYSLIKDETYEYETQVEVPVSIEDALAHYFGIDVDKVRAEREAVYAKVRAAAEARGDA